MRAPPRCPYCTAPAVLVNGTALFPFQEDGATELYWTCTPCDAYIGTYRNSTEPRGRLANPELRDAKRRLHKVYDPLWKAFPKPERTSEKHRVRKWLARRLHIPQDQCFFGIFDLDMAERAIEICEEVHNEQAIKRTAKGA